MGYRAHVCTKYEIKLFDLSSADEFKEFISWLVTSENFDDVVWCYEGEFYEYAEWVEFDRASLTNILESNEIPEKFNRMVKEIVNLGDPNNDFIRIEIY
jgi:hypothetical protein